METAAGWAQHPPVLGDVSMATLALLPWTGVTQAPEGS